MTPTWTGEETPPQLHNPRSLRDWIRVLRRGLPMVFVVFGGLVLLLIVRLAERPLFGMKRPVTPHITTAVCRLALGFLGLRHQTHGTPMRNAGATVANHGSWLDIFVLNATRQLYFVSKAEVAKWPGIGWLAQATGTLFIARDPRAARAQTKLFRDRLLAGHQLLFFPEGTSTDTKRVLNFKTTLFAAFFDDALRHEMHIQPVTLVYHAPLGTDPRYYGWWGDMAFGGHLLAMLATPKHGSAEVIFHQPVRVDDFPNRKSLAAHVENCVRNRHRDVSAGVPPEG